MKTDAYVPQGYFLKIWICLGRFAYKHWLIVTFLYPYPYPASTVLVRQSILIAKPAGSSVACRHNRGRTRQNVNIFLIGKERHAHHASKSIIYFIFYFLRRKINNFDANLFIYFLNIIMSAQVIVLHFGWTRYDRYKRIH